MWWSEERKLERKFTETERLYSREYQRAKARKASHDDLEMLAQEALFERNMIMDDLNIVRTENLLHDARRLGISANAFDKDNAKEAYREGYRPGVLYLTLAAQAELRRLLRDEKKARSEGLREMFKDIVIPTITALTGLAGTAIGIITSLHGKTH
jgi:hypothetical protein